MRFTCINGQWKDYSKDCKTFPLQLESAESLPKIVAEEAYKEYSARYGRQQSLKRLGERGGFGSAEIAILLFHRIERVNPHNTSEP